MVSKNKKIKHKRFQIHLVYPQQHIYTVQLLRLNQRHPPLPSPNRNSWRSPHSVVSSPGGHVASPGRRWLTSPPPWLRTQDQLPGRTQAAKSANVKRCIRSRAATRKSTYEAPVAAAVSTCYVLLPSQGWNIKKKCEHGALGGWWWLFSFFCFYVI